MLEVMVIIGRSGDPAPKELVEHFNGHLETSFLPGQSTGPAACGGMGAAASGPHHWAQRGDGVPRYGPSATMAVC